MKKSIALFMVLSCFATIQTKYYTGLIVPPRLAPIQPKITSVGDELVIASEENNIQEVNKILNNPNLNVSTADLLESVEWLAYHKRNEAVKTILELSTVQKERAEFLGKSLKGAAGSANIDLINWILDEPEEKDISDEDINTAITAAKYYNHQNVLDILEKEYPDIFKENTFKQEPVHVEPIDETPIITKAPATEQFAITADGTYNRDTRTAKIAGITFTNVVEQNRATTPPFIMNPKLVLFASMPTPGYVAPPKGTFIAGGTSSSTTLYGEPTQINYYKTVKDIK